MKQVIQLASDTREINSALSKQVQSRKSRAYSKLYQAIRAGHGQGHGAAYQPWLQLRRKNSSPDSNQVVCRMPLLNRAAHYLSRGEYQTALLLLWLNVSDLREQYPIWPISHPHPLHGAPGTSGLALRFVRGLLSIAQEAGIDHGSDIGSGLPYVATLDFLITIPGKEGPSLAIFSSKPVPEHEYIPEWRMLERLELERRYAEELSARYFVTSSALVPDEMAGQLECWLTSAALDEAPELLSLAETFSEYFARQPECPVIEVVTTAAKALAIPEDEALCLFRHCAWTQKIDVDPTRRVVSSYPVCPGGRKLKAALQLRFFGESW